MDQPSDQIVSGYIEGTLSLIGCKMDPITMMQDQSVIIVQFSESILLILQFDRMKDFH